MKRQYTHDLTFKSLMRNKPFFKAFLQTYLPDSVFNKMDWETAKVFKISGEHLREVFPFEGQKQLRLTADIADLTYLVSQKEEKADQQALISIHVEHQSSPDKLLPLRLNLYLLGMLYEYAKMNKKEKLPHVYSIIYYHGKVRPYPYEKDVFAMFDEAYEGEQYLFHPTFVDVGIVSDEILLEHSGIAGAEITFKHIFEKDLVPYSKTIAEGLKQVDDESHTVVLKYLAVQGQMDDIDTLFKNFEEVSPKEEKIMTLAELLEQRGFQKGKQEGKQEELIMLIKKMLAEGLALKLIQKLTGLDEAQIKQLCQRH